MARIQLALDVDDLAAAVDFYTRLLGTGPAKLRPGYANFAVADPPLKLVLVEQPGAARGGQLNHLGVEVRSTDEVADAAARLRADGLEVATEAGTTCCYAVQDKVWVSDPDGVAWEVYTVLADVDEVGEPPATVPGTDAPCACPS